MCRLLLRAAAAGIRRIFGRLWIFCPEIAKNMDIRQNYRKGGLYMPIKNWLYHYRLPLLLCGTALAVSLPLAALAAARREPPGPPESSSVPPAVSADYSAPAVSSVAAAAYRIGEWEGKLAVFLADSPSPDEVFDVYVSTLPPEEQQRISAGIEVADEVELARLLEDYTS